MNIGEVFSARHDAAQIKGQARGRWVDLLSQLGGIDDELLDGKHHPCPKCGGADRFRAFKDVAESGGVYCNRCFSKKNGDGLAALMWLNGWSFPEAVDKVADLLGSPAASRPNRRQGASQPANCRTDDSKATCRRKVFDSIEAALVAYDRSVGGERSTQWEYHDLVGNVVCVVARWELGEGKKTFRPVTPRDGGWIYGDPPKPWPLYDLPKLAEADIVVLVEGEKCAEDAKSIGLVATATLHGANSPSYTDYSPLAGKTVWILPDNDKPGRDYAQTVATILNELEPRPTIKIVTLPNLPEKGGIDDWIRPPIHGEAAEPEQMRAEIEDLADMTPEWSGEPALGSIPSAAPRARIVRLADVEAEEISWLWPGRIALGKLTLIAGDPGLGKSFLSLDLAARVTNGAKWPDCDDLAPQGSVVLLSAEDGLADTVRPRLDAAGANANKVFSIQAAYDHANGQVQERPLNLQLDLEVIAEVVKECRDCRLLIIDPISAYVGKTDSNSNTEIRAMLSPVSALAADHGIAVVMLTHLRKGDGAAVYRPMGSLAFAAASRAVWAVAKDKGDEQRRLLLPVKNNLGNDRTGLAFTLAQCRSIVPVPCVLWEPAAIETTADEALDRGGRPQPDASDEAMDFLMSALAGGPRLTKEVEEESRESHGIAKRTLDRARKVLGVESYRQAIPGPWWLCLPGQQCNTAA